MKYPTTITGAILRFNDNIARLSGPDTHRPTRIVLHPETYRLFLGEIHLMAGAVPFLDPTYYRTGKIELECVEITKGTKEKV